MGYTHYYTLKGGTDRERLQQYREVLPQLQDIAARYKDILCHEYDEEDQPAEVSLKCIFLNGKGDDGHETFCFDPLRGGFRFCKTDRKPYDLPVCEMLLVLAAAIPSLKLSSDGFNRDGSTDEPWPEAMDNVLHLYGIRATYGAEDGLQLNYVGGGTFNGGV